MKNINKDIFTSMYPHLDLHGEFVAIADTLIKEFINDNYKMQNATIIIIHGKGSGALKDIAHEILSKDKRVLEFRFNDYNIGETIVKFKPF